MAGPDLSAYGAPAPGPDLSAFGSEPKAVDLSAFGSDKPVAKRSFLDDLGDTFRAATAPLIGAAETAIGHPAGPGPSLARAAAAGLAGGVARSIKGLGSVVDAADRMLMSPEERQAFDYGQRTIGPAPTFSDTVAPVAKLPAAAHDALAPKKQTAATRISEGVGGLGAYVGASLINPVLGAGAFGTSGAQDMQDTAERLGVAGTPKADLAVLGNAGAQAALGSFAPAGLATGAIPALGSTAARRLLTSAAGNALLGAAMPTAENAIARSTVEPDRPLLQGVPESAAEMALIGAAAHAAHGLHSGPEPSPAAEAPDLSAFGEPANDVAPPVAPPAAPVSPPKPTAPAAHDDFPGDWAPAPAREPTPAPTAPATAPDMTDRALDVLRSGGKVRIDQGLSLVDFLARNGGLADPGGDLGAMDAGLWHRDQAFRPRLIRPDGRSIEDAAQAAHDAGYFPEVPPASMDGGENMHPVSSDALLSAVREELSGKPRFAKADEHGMELSQHVDDLDQLTQELGLDPATMSNAEIKTAIDSYFRQPVGANEPAARKLGAAAPTPEATDGLSFSEGKSGDGKPTFWVEHESDPGKNYLFGWSEPGRLRIERSTVAPEARGQGLGVSLYERAIHEAGTQGKGVASDIEVSPAAARVWDALERRGYTVARNPTATLSDLPRNRGKAWVTSDGEPVFSIAPDATSPAAPAAKLAMAGGDATGGRNARVQEVLSRAHAPDLSAFASEVTPAGSLAKSGGLRGAPQPGAIPAADPRHIARLDDTVSTLAKDLRRVLGLTHRQGRLSVRVKGGKALGEFDPGSGVVRTRAVHEMDVLAHEATHHLEYQKPPALMAALKAHAADLKPLAYAGASPDALRQEGFAEFGRWYLTNPDYARKVAPKFYEAFEAALAKDDPAALAGMRKIQSAYQAFLSAPSAAAVRSTIVRAAKPSVFKDMAEDVKARGFAGAVDKWTNDLYRDFIDDLHPVNQAVEGLLDVYRDNKGAKLDLPAAKNPYALARMSRGAFSAGHVDALYGVVPYHGIEPEGPGLQDALGKAFGGKWSDEAFDDFGAYLASRRLVHEWDRYDAGTLDRPPDKLTKEAHVQAIADFEAANPTWRDAAAMVHTWAENHWRKKFEGGLISESTHGSGVREHKDYVPLLRDVSDKERAGAPGVSGNRKFAGGARKFRGSTRDIINPIQSLMQDAYTTSGLLARNDVVGALYNLGTKAGNGAGAFVERIPAHEYERFTVDTAEALEKAAEEIGLSRRDVDTLMEAAGAAGESQIAFYKPGEISERGEPIIFYWKGGEKIPLRLPDGDFGKAMFDSLTGMNRQAKNLFVEVFSAPSRLLRLGVTTQPEFFFANYVRDQIANWIISDVGFKPFISGARGIADELAQGDLARRYNTVGGIVGGANVASLDKARVDRDIKALNQKGYKFKRFLSIEGAIKASEVSETGTRLGLFRLAEKQAKAKGLNDWEAAVHAAFTARDVLDFDRRGSKMLSAIRTVTFLNASLQGLDKARRVLGAEGKALPTIARTVAPWIKSEKGLPLTPTEKAQLVHAGKAWAKVAAIGALGLALAAHYGDDPEYQEISPYLRATHWMFRIGKGTWAAVPKPFELATLSNILERGYEGVVQHDPNAWGNLFDGLGQILVPPTGITALTVPFDIARNRSSQGQPIVPDYLRNGVEPELQFNSFTSDFSKRLGAALHLSPAVLDYLITGFGGSWGRTILGATDVALKDKGRLGGAGLTDGFITRRFVRDVTRGSSSSGEFWDNLAQDGGKLTRAEGTFRSYVASGEADAAQKYFESLPPTARSYIAASVLLPGAAKQIHPLVGALDRERLITDLRRDLAKGDIRGPDLRTPLNMTPDQRRQADEALAYMSMALMRDALISAGEKGWAQKAPISQTEAAAQLFRASPGLAAVYRQRVALAGPLPEAVGEQAWSKARAFLETPRAGQFAAQTLKARAMSGKEGVMNFLRTAPNVAGAAP